MVGKGMGGRRRERAIESRDGSEAKRNAGWVGGEREEGEILEKRSEITRGEEKGIKRERVDGRKEGSRSKRNDEDYRLRFWVRGAGERDRWRRLGARRRARRNRPGGVFSARRVALTRLPACLPRG